MFVLRKYDHVTKIKGVLVIWHLEIKFIDSKRKHLNDKYHIICTRDFLENSLLSFCCNYIPCESFNRERKKENSLEILSQKYNLGIYNLGIYNLRPEERPIDCIYVGRSTKAQSPIQIMEYFIHIYQKYNKRSLFLILEQADVNKDTINCVKKLYNSQTEIVKQNINIVDTHLLKTSSLFKGFCPQELAIFYKNSKILINADDVPSRVVAEAALCGCFVVFKSSKRGYDYLKTSKASLTFRSFDFSHFDKSIEMSDKYVYDEDIEKVHSSKHTIDFLLKLVYNKFAYSIPYDEFCSEIKDRKDYHLKFASHDLTVPWYEEGKLTANILNEKQYEILKEYL